MVRILPRLNEGTDGWRKGIRESPGTPPHTKSGPPRGFVAHRDALGEGARR